LRHNHPCRFWGDCAGTNSRPPFDSKAVSVSALAAIAFVDGDVAAFSGGYEGLRGQHDLG
jgi:hypothetical protein